MMCIWPCSQFERAGQRMTTMEALYGPLSSVQEEEIGSRDHSHDYLWEVVLFVVFPSRTGNADGTYGSYAPSCSHSQSALPVQARSVVCSGLPHTSGSRISNARAICRIDSFFSVKSCVFRALSKRESSVCSRTYASTSAMERRVVCPSERL